MKPFKIDADSASILTTREAQLRISKALLDGDILPDSRSRGVVGSIELSKCTFEVGDIALRTREVVVASCASRSLSEGYRVLAARLDGEDVDPDALPPEAWSVIHKGLGEGYASLRPKAEVTLADRLEAIASGKNATGADAKALAEAAEILRRQVRPAAAESLGMGKEVAIGLTASLSGLDPLRSIRLARESHPVLDALTDVEDGKEVVLTAAQARTVMAMMLAAHGK